MSDGELILVAGAAGRRPRRRPARGRLRVPGLLLFLGLGMLLGLGRPRLDRPVRLRAGPAHRRSSPWRRSSSRAGWWPASPRSGPCCGPGLTLAVVGTIVTAAITGVAAVWLFDLTTLEGLLLGAIARRHRRRGHLRAAARVHAPAPPGTDARGRGRVQRPDRDPARDRLHRVDPAARLRRARHGRALRPADLHRRWRWGWPWASPRCGRSGA